MEGSLEQLSVSRIDPHTETERYRQHVLESKGKTLDAAGRARMGRWESRRSLEGKRRWRRSLSKMLIADIDQAALDASTERLRRLGAPVVPIHGPAVTSAERMIAAVNAYGLYLAFLDPYNLEALDFRIIEALARLKRVDLVIHLSARICSAT